MDFKRMRSKSYFRIVPFLVALLVMAPTDGISETQSVEWAFHANIERWCLKSERARSEFCFPKGIEKTYENDDEVGFGGVASDQAVISAFYVHNMSAADSVRELESQGDYAAVSEHDDPVKTTKLRVRPDAQDNYNHVPAIIVIDVGGGGALVVFGSSESSVDDVVRILLRQQ